MVDPKSSSDEASEWEVEVERDPIGALCKLLEEGGFRVTFDLKRNFMLPCIDCGTTQSPRHLVDIGWDEERKDDITRPICARCILKRGITVLRKPR